MIKNGSGKSTNRPILTANPIIGIGGQPVSTRVPVSNPSGFSPAVPPITSGIAPTPINTHTNMATDPAGGEGGTGSIVSHISRGFFG
jgi:hypothetical protein